jgi:hypothetical protein
VLYELAAKGEAGNMPHEYESRNWRVLDQAVSTETDCKRLGDLLEIAIQALNERNRESQTRGFQLQVQNVLLLGRSFWAETDILDA